MTIANARLCAVGLFVALLVSACGDDNELSGAKAGYVAQVDPICAELQGKIGDLGSEPEQQAADVEAAVMRIKEVDQPRDDSARADIFIVDMENLYLSLQDVHQARLVNDTARAARAIEGARMNAQTAADAAEEYGMVVCAREL
ncbi:MAG: hypothetical protein ACRD1D_03285 [Acidimicrobiales bacterium]